MHTSERRQEDDAEGLLPHLVTLLWRFRRHLETGTTESVSCKPYWKNIYYCLQNHLAKMNHTFVYMCVSCVLILIPHSCSWALFHPPAHPWPNMDVIFGRFWVVFSGLQEGENLFFVFVGWLFFYVKIETRYHTCSNRVSAFPLEYSWHF